MVVVGLFMFPLFWWVLTSFKTDADMFNPGPLTLFNFTPTLDNYRVAFFGLVTEAFNARKAIINSFIVAGGASLLCTFIAALSAFALSHFQFKQRGRFLYAVLVARFVPPIALLIPLFFIYNRLHLRDSYFGLIIVNAALNVPFAILVLKSFFEDVPREVSEAAKLDGASTAQIFRLIYVPLLKGGIAATALLCFIFTWIEFLAASMLAGTTQVLPIYLLNVESLSWSFVTAVGSVALLPCFVVIAFSQRYLTRAFTLGFQKD